MSDNDTKKTPDNDDMMGNGNTDGRENASEMDFLDDPEALIAAEEAALEAEAEEAAAEAEGMKKPVENIPTLKAQVAELTDRLLRAHADMENQRKMAEKEREDTAKYAISKFAKDIVQVGDNFQRAISAVPQDAVDSDPALKSFLDGVSMLDREFHNILERHNIKRIEPTGEPFNPHFHQAMMEQDNPSVPHGTVLQVIQAGYMLSDRVMRPAMVVVAKGGPKGAPRPSDAEPAQPPAADNENTADSGGDASENSGGDDTP